MVNVKIIFLSLVVLSSSFINTDAYAVPKEVKAKSEFVMADKLYNKGDLINSIKHAQKAKSLLGNSAPRIEYLLTKAYAKTDQPIKAMEAIENFFAITPDSAKSSDIYAEMVALYTEIEIEKNKREAENEVLRLKQDAEKAAVKAKYAPYLSEIEMIKVSGECLKRGSLFKDTTPVHEICLDDFSIGKFEVSQGLWMAVMGTNPAHNNSSSDSADFPVEMVSWDLAQVFISELNKITTKKFRLPTEAEWELACVKSNTEESYYCGGNNAQEFAWVQYNSSGSSHKVGTKSPNKLGIHDMSGNVWEMCQDWYEAEYYSAKIKDNPSGPSSGSERVLRGGGWKHNNTGVPLSYRSSINPKTHSNNIGFRLAL